MVTLHKNSCLVFKIEKLDTTCCYCNKKAEYSLIALKWTLSQKKCMICKEHAIKFENNEVIP